MNLIGWWVTRQDLFGGEDGAGWLARHRLPRTAEAVRLVDERLCERRLVDRATWFARLAAALAGLAGVVAATVEGWPEDLLTGTFWAVLLPMLGLAAAADVLVRRRMWRRWDARLAAVLPARIAPLARPGYRELVGRTALVCWAWLLAGGLAYALSLAGTGKPVASAAAAGIVALSAAHTVGQLETARRRPVVAGDVEALAIDDRLRGEDAAQAVSSGVYWLGMLAVVDLGNGWGLLFLLGLFAVAASVRHRYAYVSDGETVVPA